MVKSSFKDEFLYHYTTADGLIGILTNYSFWASKHNFMNDPMELKFVNESIKNLSDLTVYDELDMTYKSLLTPDHKEYNNSELDLAVRKTLLNYIFYPDSEWPYNIDHFYIISFSTVNDSLALWERYVNQGGYMLVFRKRELLSALRMAIAKYKKTVNITSYHRAVRYIDSFKRLRSILEKSIIQAMNMLRSVGLESLNYESDNKLKKDMMAALRSLNTHRISIKTKTFLDEKEYRFVICVEDSFSSDSIINFRTRNSLILPYLQLDLKNLDSLKAVVVSPLQKDLDFLDGLRMFLKKQKLEHVQILSSDLRYRK